MIEATFLPKVMNDLSRGAQALIGQRLKFLEGWEIETGYKYAGQTAWIPFGPPIGWIPTEDLDSICYLDETT